MKYPNKESGYEIIKQIGCGACSSVYKAKCKETNEICAIKIIDLDKNVSEIEFISKEVNKLMMSQHENVIKMYASFIENHDLWIVMEYFQCSGKDILHDYYPSGIKDEELLANILYEIAKGIEYLHKNNIIHRDIKSGNILISENGNTVLCDFGVSSLTIEEGKRIRRTTFTGTPTHMAPEVMEQKEYDNKADIWSFGILMMELSHGYAPYAHYPPLKILLSTIQNDPPTCDIYNDRSHTFSEEFYSLISKCIRKDTTKRYSIEKVMEHKVFKQIKDINKCSDFIKNKLEKILKNNGNNIPTTTSIDEQK